MDVYSRENWVLNYVHKYQHGLNKGEKNHASEQETKTKRIDFISRSHSCQTQKVQYWISKHLRSEGSSFEGESKGARSLIRISSGESLFRAAMRECAGNEWMCASKNSVRFERKSARFYRLSGNGTRERKEKTNRNEKEVERKPEGDLRLAQTIQSEICTSFPKS